MREDVEAGAALADAMKKHPKTFDALYSNMIAAGEAGGILDTILKRLAVYIEKNVKLKGDVKSAMIYPIAVIVIAAVVVGAILWKVIPTFATLFAGLGAQLPLPTRIVIAMSDGVVAWGWLVVLSIFAFGWMHRPLLLNARRPSRNRRAAAEDPGARQHPSKGLRRPFLSNTLDTAVVGRPDSRRPRHYRAHVRQRHHRGRDPKNALGHRAR